VAKVITDPQIIGAQGEALVSARAKNAMGFMFSRYGPLEAGLDGLLEIRDPETGICERVLSVRLATFCVG
jgi:hypothetical protein